MNFRCFNKGNKKIIALSVTILILMNCTTTKQTSFINQDETFPTSKSIVLHNGEHTYYFFKVKHNKKDLIGSAIPTGFKTKQFKRSKLDQLHIFLNTGIDIPKTYPAEINIMYHEIKKIEIYESNPGGTILLVASVLAGFLSLMYHATSKRTYQINLKN